MEQPGGVPASLLSPPCGGAILPAGRTDVTVINRLLSRQKAGFYLTRR